MTAPVTFSLALSNETATAHLMADLALLIGPGDLITLSGDLGAGKTAAARAMIRYLADDDALEVPSPTFTLAQSYDLAPFPLVHADLYRVNDPIELEEIGLQPLPEATVVLIEWPERAAGALPEDRIDIALSHRPALGSAARSAATNVFPGAICSIRWMIPVSVAMMKVSAASVLVSWIIPSVEAIWIPSGGRSPSAIR